MIDVNNLEGVRIYDADGQSIGRVYDLFVDDKTNRPEWLLLDTTGVNRDRIVPIVDVHEHEDGISVPFTRDQVDGAPRVGGRFGLSEQDERRLYEHYGLAYGTCVGAMPPCSETLLPRGEGAGLVDKKQPGGGRLGPEMTEQERAEDYRLVLIRHAVSRVPHGPGENVMGEHTA